MVPLCAAAAAAEIPSVLDLMDIFGMELRCLSESFALSFPSLLLLLLLLKSQVS